MVREKQFIIQARARTKESSGMLYETCMHAVIASVVAADVTSIGGAHTDRQETAFTKAIGTVTYSRKLKSHK
jgi:hypothetical protein